MVAFVLSKNMMRRHLDESQRGMVATRLATLNRSDNQHRSNDLSSITQSKAAELLNVSVPTVKRARRVVERDGHRKRSFLSHRVL